MSRRSPGDGLSLPKLKHYQGAKRGGLGFENHWKVKSKGSVGMKKGRGRRQFRDCTLQTVSGYR